MGAYLVKRKGKNPGVEYFYRRYVHYHTDKRRKVRRTYCYLSVTHVQGSEREAKTA